MTETGFYIMFFLQNEMHGYNIGQKVKQMTDGLIQFLKEEENRKFYIITELGKEILEIELKRIERLYKNSKGAMDKGKEN